MTDGNIISENIKSIACSIDYRQERLISFFSAVIAYGRYELTRKAIVRLKDLALDRNMIYETILQSYLFLGFPRMIEAALAFNEVYGDFTEVDGFKTFSQDESRQWFEDGRKLCRRVYGKNYDRLEQRFIAMSPDLFRWMVIEGYGKVLSRPGLTQIERELAEVAALIVDKRERQLVSHIMGSLNVGADPYLIKLVNNDIRAIAGDESFRLANDVIRRVGMVDEEKK
jgi:alkylhydroperoxidase/carboxymuconolactone decarboxylase family protein YurZ